MHTQLITLEVSLIVPPDELRGVLAQSRRLCSDALRSHIEDQLTQHGSPLRWAITSVNASRQTAQIEAVVTTI